MFSKKTFRTNDSQTILCPLGAYWNPEALAFPPQKNQELWGRVQPMYFTQLPVVRLRHSRRCCIRDLIPSMRLNTFLAS